MQPDAAQAMTYFFYNIDVFLLVLVRIFGFVIIMPVLTGANIPMTVKVMFTIAIGYVVFSAHMIISVEYYNNIVGFGMLVAEEFIVGFLIAFMVYAVFGIMYFVGQLIDTQIGFSMATIFDPVTQIQVPIVGNMLFMMMGLFLIQSGGLHTFISALFFSYDVLPIGQAFVLNNGSIVSHILQLMATYFVLGVQISMPLVGSILVVDIALGLLVKAVPQMNIFVVGMPLKMLFGLAILYSIVPIFSDVYDMLFLQATRAVITMIRELTP